jgi:type I restriction enzyme S subunit
MSSVRPIGSFAKVRRGASPRPIHDPRYFGGEVGWVRISDVTQRNYKYLRQTTQYLSALGESKSLRVDKGDLVMSICATVGKPIIIDMAACIHDGFVQLYDIQDADIEYLFYLLQFHEKDFEKRGQPGTQVNLNTSIVESELVFFPSIGQQQKIAKILTTVDNLIEKTQALIDKYTAIKQGMMADLFTRGIDLSGTPDSNPHHGQLRPPFERAPELYKETELGWVPKEWEVKPLGSLAEKITSGSRDWGTYYADEGDLFVRISNLTREHINFRWKSIRYVDIGGGSEGERTKLEEGDLLVSITADLGIIGIVPSDLGRAFINQHTALVRLIFGSSDPRYIGHYLQSYSGQFQFEKFNDSGAKAGLNLPTVASIECFYPSLKEQLLIAARIDQVDKQIAVLKVDREKREKQKKGLMRDLLTGTVGVN